MFRINFNTNALSKNSSAAFVITVGSLSQKFRLNMTVNMGPGSFKKPLW